MIQINRSFLWVGLIPAMILVSCGGSKEEEEEKKEAESVSASGALGALKDMAKQAEEVQKNGPVETVDFRTLKELLPADADGLPRKEATGEKNGAAGFVISTANGKYANEDGSETIDLSIVDAGGTAMTIGMAAWSAIVIDKETDTGYEKTSTMDDNKTYEKYDNASKDGELNVLVNKRYIVSAKGHGVSMDKLKDIVKDLNLDKLGALK